MIDRKYNILIALSLLFLFFNVFDSLITINALLKGAEESNIIFRLLFENDLLAIAGLFKFMCVYFIVSYCILQYESYHNFYYSLIPLILSNYFVILVCVHNVKVYMIL